MRKSTHPAKALLALPLPFSLLALLAGGVVSSLGSLGFVAVGAVCLAFLAMFVGFGLPILRLGQPPSQVKNHAESVNRERPANRGQQAARDTRTTAIAA